MVGIIFMLHGLFLLNVFKGIKLGFFLDLEIM